MDKWRQYVQGAAGATIAAMLIGLLMGCWNLWWENRWQSGELYRLKTQVEEQQKVTAEVVKWINGVIQAQQQGQRQPAATPGPGQ